MSSTPCSAIQTKTRGVAVRVTGSEFGSAVDRRLVSLPLPVHKFPGSDTLSAVKLNGQDNTSR